MRRLATLLLALACVGPVSLQNLRAQDQPAHAASQQELAQTKFREVTERMQNLMALLAKNDPHNDKSRIDIALKFIAERKVKEQMERAKTLLDGERWDDAQKLMQGIQTDLRRVLELLQNRNPDLQKLLERIAALQGFRNEVDKLAKEEGREKNDSAMTEELQKQLEALAKAKSAAEQLLA